MGSVTGYPHPQLLIDFSNNPGNGYGTTAWSDFTSRILSIESNRGRETEFDRFESGQLRVRLSNRDGVILPSSIANYRNPNLLTENQSSVEKDLTGFANSGGIFLGIVAATLTRLTADQLAQFGESYLQVVTTNAASAQGVRVTFPVTNGQTYTFSVYVRGALGGEPLRIGIGGSGLGSATLDITPPSFVFYTRYQVTFTATGTGTAEAAVYTRTATATQFHIDGLQVENAASATDWLEPQSSPKCGPGARVQFGGFRSTDGKFHKEFVGFVEALNPIKLGWGRFDGVELLAVDTFAALAMGKYSGARLSERSDVRIGAMLDAAFWPTTERNLDVGQTTVTGGTYTSASILQVCQEAEDAESGFFFCSKDGKATFQNRYARINQSGSVATFSDVQSSVDSGAAIAYSDASIEFSNALIYNDIVLTASGSSSPQESFDLASEQQYFLRTLAKTVGVPTDLEAFNMTAYLLTRYKDPKVRVNKLLLSSAANNSAMELQQLSRDVGDRITVTVTLGAGTTVTNDYYIEHVNHKVGDDKEWTTEWALSPADLYAYWLLDSTTNSILDSTTKLSY